MSDVESQADINDRSIVASFFGTLQAGFTDFKYLRPIWRTTTEEEALIGVSQTGIASGRVLGLNLREAADLVKQTNEVIAGVIGINPAARCTAIKPAGCQVESTMVSTTKGIMSLRELNPGTEDKGFHPHFMEVYSDRGVELSNNFFVNGFNLTKKIKLDSGITLECTHNHKYRAIRNNEYVWVRADELEIDDKLCYSIGEYEGGEYQPLTGLEFRPKKMDHTSKPLKTPTVLDEDLAWVLGLYFGDGSNHRKGVRIHGNYSEQKGFDKASEIMFDKFGLRGTMYKHKLESKDLRCALYFNSTQLIPFLENNNLSKKKSADLEFPLIVRMSPKSVIEAFIEGYYTADGCDKNKSGKTSCTISEKFSSQLVVVLRAIGRDAKTREMPSTESSYGENLRYWTSERNLKNTKNSPFRRKYLKESWAVLERETLNTLSVDKIVSIEDSANYTYDIEVPSNNTYLANSYVSHNTTSCVVGSSSGIHAYHSEYYIRTMRLNKIESIAQYLIENHPNIVEDDLFDSNQIVVSIPIQSPVGSITRKESVFNLLERINKFNEEWVREGHRSGANTNNVSATVSINGDNLYGYHALEPAKDEWEVVGEWMWTNRSGYNGLSVLPFDNGSYQQAPFQTCTKEKYERMLSLVEDLNIDDVKEEEDKVDFGDSIACGPQGCELK